jgi:hypothetical protein
MRKAGGTVIGTFLRDLLRSHTTCCCGRNNTKGPRKCAGPSPWWIGSHQADWNCTDFEFKELEYGFMDPRVHENSCIFTITHIRHPKNRIASHFFYEGKDKALRTPDNVTMWNKYLDTPTRDPALGYLSLAREYYPNYYALHLGKVQHCPSDKKGDNATIKDLMFTQCSPSPLASINMDDIDHVVHRLGKFSLVLTDADGDVQQWQKLLTEALTPFFPSLASSTLKKLNKSNAELRINKDHKSGFGYEIPDEISKRIERENAVDMEIYSRFLATRKTIG